MTEDRKWRWLELIAATVTVIGIAGLIALVARSAWAAEPGGFTRGARNFNNPFAGGNTAGADEAAAPEENDDADFLDDSFPNQPAGTGNAGAGAEATPGNPIRGRSGIQVGGGTPGGVVTHNKAPNLFVDSETAAGSKEIITDFNFPDADILDIAKTLGKLTGKNFIYDKDVKGRVTLLSNTPITVGEAWKSFLTALDMNGFALIPSGAFIRIARQRDARDKQLKTYTGDFAPDTDALITRVFPLKYLTAEEVARNFRSFMPANSRIIPYDQTNTVIVTDTGSNIAKLNKLLEILDVEGYDAGIEVIPVKFASASELSKLIDTLIPGSTAAGGPGGPRFGGGGGGGRFNARRTKEGGIINTIIADERTNTLIVHANNRGADQVRELVSKLDQKLPSSTGGKVHVIYLQFEDAEQIASTLNNISSASATGSKPGGPSGGTGVNPVQASLFEGSIKIAPDKSTNSLVITASPGDFVNIQRIVNKLDIPRDQVFAEVVIMEVTVGHDFDFSANVASPTSGLGLLPRGTDLLALATSPLSQAGAILSFAAGGTSTIKVNGVDTQVANVQGLIKAIQSNTNSNVLATPQILTMDNTEATFEAVEKVPVASSTVTATGVSSNSISKENVSLSITIKPQINKMTNYVKLDIKTKSADVSTQHVPAALVGQAFTTVERNANTSVLVGDKDTVVLGGLSRDSIQDSTSKIPILGDIPVLGWLFKAKTSSTNKSNLLIFITPQIIRQYDSVRTVLDRKLKERDEFMESSTGGSDPMRKYRDDMIRRLPDIRTITDARPNNSQTIGEEDDGPQVNPGDRNRSSTVPNGRNGGGANSPSPGAGAGANVPNTASGATSTALPSAPDVFPAPTFPAPESIPGGVR